MGPRKQTSRMLLVKCVHNSEIVSNCKFNKSITVITSLPLTVHTDMSPFVVMFLGTILCVFSVEIFALKSSMVITMSPDLADF